MEGTGAVGIHEGTEGDAVAAEGAAGPCPRAGRESAAAAITIVSAAASDP
jgi:hypothetical protein